MPDVIEGSAVLDPWDQRSPALAAMLNPALIAATIATSVIAYERESNEAMPAPYAFIVVPLVLHRGTRSELPRNVTTHWSTWIANHPVLLAGFPSRAIALKEHIREGFRFALRCGVVALDNSGGLVSSGKGVGRTPRGNAGDLDEIIDGARKLGRWLTKIDRPATVFALLGVQP